MHKLLVVCLLVIGLWPVASQARDEYFWQQRYCESVELEKHLPSGGYVDCVSDEFAIEVEWADNWAEGVGQAFYYAAATNRKPGIILLCESSEGPVEDRCRSYVYRLDLALKLDGPSLMAGAKGAGQ